MFHYHCHHEVLLEWAITVSHKQAKWTEVYCPMLNQYIIQYIGTAMYMWLPVFAYHSGLRSQTYDNIVQQ